MPYRLRLLDNLPARAMFKAMAIACRCGLPSDISNLILSLITRLLFLFGIGRPFHCCAGAFAFVLLAGCL
jgi:hypothetical protein